MSGLLLATGLALPVAMLLAYLSPRLRERVPALLPLAPVPALVAALFGQGGAIVLPRALLGLSLGLDAPGAALLLGVAALLWIFAGFYASTWLRGEAGRGRFVIWWLLTLTGSIGTFMAADLVSFYLLYSVVSLAAYGLVAHDGTARAQRAGTIYMAVTVLGEAFLLMAFVFMAQATPGGSLLIRDAVAALPGSPWRAATLALLVLGFGSKMGLVPLHVWMPVAHPAAPIPASAVLSGVAVKAGVIGFIRFLPFAAVLPVWGGALTAVGFCTAFFAVAVGITQSNAKTVLAYSTVSQMGVLAAVFGMGLAAGDPGVALVAAFYAVHHLLVKGALFLAVGVAGASGGRRVWLVLLPALVLSLSLAGLPLTGGFLAKLMVKAPLGSGVVGLLGTLSSVGTALLMLHFMRLLATVTAVDATASAPVRLSGVWLAAGFAAVAVPWCVMAVLWDVAAIGMLAPGAVWSAIWPLLLGGVLAIALGRWGGRLPRVPEGDVVVVAERLATVVRARADLFVRMDEMLGQWTVAGVLLLAVAIVLGAAMLAG